MRITITRASVGTGFFILLLVFFESNIVDLHSQLDVRYTFNPKALDGSTFHHMPGRRNNSVLKQGNVSNEIDRINCECPCTCNNASIEYGPIERELHGVKGPVRPICRGLVRRFASKQGDALKVASDGTPHCTIECNSAVCHRLLVRQTVSSPTAELANKLLHDQGILLRVPDFVNRTDYLPASFVHASMRSPNVMFRTQGENVTVGFLIGSKFQRLKPFDDSNISIVEGSVYCQAYYPIDSWSIMRSQSLEGTSCTSYQKKKPLFSTESNQSYPRYLFDLDNECACNYHVIPGRVVVRFMVRRRVPNLHICWYPGTNEGIQELVDASNVLYMKRSRVFRHRLIQNATHYQGWTECSSSGNIDSANMADAIVLQLPHFAVTEEKLPSFQYLDGIQLRSLAQSLEQFAYLNLPVLVLEETKGMNPEECAKYWNGKTCFRGYRKEFVPHEWDFGDGSCLAKFDGDDEVRFYPSSRGVCSLKSHSLS